MTEEIRERRIVHVPSTPGRSRFSNAAARGIAVHIASRLTGLASPDEVFVSGTVRDLVGGSGFTCVGRGMHAVKGVQRRRLRAEQRHESSALPRLPGNS